MSTAPITQTEPAIACNMDGIASEQREGHKTIAHAIFASVQELKALPDGYALRLPTESAMLLKLAEYISNERLCCSFFRFTIVIEPDGGPFWFHLTGSEGAKAFVRDALMGLLTAEVVEAAGPR